MFSRSLPTMALIAVLGLLFGGRTAHSNLLQSQDEQSTPKGNRVTADQKHYEEVNKHGDAAMGFSHLKATHHFRLTPSGGFIQVEANALRDVTTRVQVQRHLQHISKAFKVGDFSAPEFTHGRIPPGVPTMQRLKSEIDYKYVETQRGGRVLIRTANPEALKAVHEFLRFQIEDHRTGDPKTVQK